MSQKLLYWLLFFKGHSCCTTSLIFQDIKYWDFSQKRVRYSSPSWEKGPLCCIVCPGGMLIPGLFHNFKRLKHFPFGNASVTAFVEKVCRGDVDLCLSMLIWFGQRNTMDLWDQVILCCRGCLVHCRMISNTPSLWMPAISLLDVITKNVSIHCQMSKRSRILQAENHCGRVVASCCTLCTMDASCCTLWVLVVHCQTEQKGLLPPPSL